VLTTEGGVRCWGDNYWGQLGNGTTIPTSSPPQTDVFVGARSIGACGATPCVVTDTNGVRCWGYPTNLFDNYTGYPVLTPPANDALTDVQSLVADSYGACIITTSGGLRCWGRNYEGELGDGTTIDKPDPPITDVLTDVEDVFTYDGYFGYTCALRTDGGLRCWGQYPGHTLPRSSPELLVPSGDLLTGVEALAGADEALCAVMTTGTLRCWGSLYGNNGLGLFFDDTPAKSHEISFSPDGVKAVALGESHICVLTTSGVVHCWGNNVFGQLGNGEVSDALKPEPLDAGAQAGVLTGVETIAAAGNHTCALTTTGDVYCWGDRLEALGDGAQFVVSSPAAVTGSCQ
jgi:alpha-tubulin suppressor-like RCC1 family protein